jgi:hypothetical protein
MPTDEENIERFHAHATDHLNSIRKMLPPDMKMTLIIRDPNDADGEIILTDDDFGGIEGAVQRAKRRSRMMGDVIDGKAERH